MLGDFPPLGDPPGVTPLEKKTATHCSISFVEDPMDRGAWWAAAHGVTVRLSTHTPRTLKVKGGCTGMSDSLRPHGLRPVPPLRLPSLQARVLRPTAGPPPQAPCDSEAARGALCWQRLSVGTAWAG